MDYSKNYYSTLGIDHNTDDDAIKKTYRTLSFKYHPDKNPGDKSAEEKFKDISEAYSVLSDKKQRNEYDKRSKYGKNYDAAFENFYQGRGFDPFSVFNQAESIFAEMRKQEARAAELSVVLNVEISDRQMYDNESMDLEYERKEPCRTCNGFGFDASNPDRLFDCEYCNGSGTDRTGKSHCHNCHGYGQISDKKCSDCNGVRMKKKKEKITLSYPMSFLGQKQTVQRRGEGNYSQDMQHIGPLIINISHKQTEEVSYRGSDIYRSIDVHYQDAIEGTPIEYRHLDGKTYKINLKAGCNNGEKIRLSGKGLQKMTRSGFSKERGDTYLIVNIFIDYDRVNKKKAK